jgi:hypothetical protein
LSRKQEPKRRFKVRGQDLVGTEMSRAGDRITLMCAAPGWPFVRERDFERAELVRLDGGTPEPEVGGST